MDKFIKENLNSDEIKNRSGIYRFWCKDHSYIGSAKNLKKRLLAHLSTMRNNRHHNHTVQNVYNKYGPDLFYFEILEHCTEQELLERETFYIKTLKPDMNHILDSVRYIKDQETIEKTRASQIEYYKTHRPINCKPVYQYNINGDFIKEFSSATEAANQYNIGPTSICGCCNGRFKTAQGFRWSYTKQNSLPKLKKIYKIKPIYQLDKNNNLIAVWYNYTELSRQLHIDPTTLKKYLNKNEIYKDCFWTNIDSDFQNVKYEINPCLKFNKHSPNIKASKKVYQYDLNGNFLNEFSSTSEADRYFGAKSFGAVSAAARKDTNNKTAYGYMWDYDKFDKISPYENNSSKAKIVSVYVFDIFNNKYLIFDSIADAVRSISGNKNFSSDCATFSSCCKDGLIFKNKYIVSYSERFKLTNKRTVIYNSVANKFYANAKIAAKENNISVWRIKQNCIDQNNVEWVYVVDSARVKLGESGKLLK